MDSEDSRDASSGNASPNSRKGPRSPSISRSVSPSSAPESPRSRSSSPEDSRSGTHSRPRSRQKSRSPRASSSSHSSPASRPSSPPGSRPRSPPTHPESPLNNDGPRSPSPANSSRSSSLGPKSPKSPDDQHSTKSTSSRSSNKSDSPDRKSLSPDRKSVSKSGSISGSSRASQKDGNTSDSSEASIDSSSRKNKNISKNIDTQPEEISDGDIESDQEKALSSGGKEKKVETIRHEININHEDLSDVSDLDESIGGHSDDELKDIKENGDAKKEDTDVLVMPEKTNRAEEGEEQLDFEAEDGECDADDKKDKDEKDTGSIAEEGETIEPKEKEKEELEEGEVSDEDEVRPEETEPRPVCRFFSRGQCTWGASCRFLHPGVTDKGNYTMFELIRPVVPGEYGREERPYGRGTAEPAPVESAWERGLRTAKEMLRKSIKRKEQDIDFEEKKMNLSLAQEEFDKENGYYGRVASPEQPRYVRVPVEYPAPRAAPPAEEYYGRRQVVYEPEYTAPPPPPRERVRTYRELPSHRMPDYYNNKYEDEAAAAAGGSTAIVKNRKPKREVIVQRAEERPVRGDEWSDPWMRSKSPANRKGGSGGGGAGGGGIAGTGAVGSGGRKRSYSSGSSYSSSSSSRSSSGSSRSSFRSRSRSRKRRRSRSHRTRLSPSVIVSERKAANERAALMNPPAPRKRAPSPGMMRVSGTNPPAPTKEDQFGRTRSKMAIAAAIAARVKGRRRSSKSSSDSSASSSSDSDSSGSSSSSSRDGSSPRRATGMDISIAKAMDALKGNAAEKRQIKLNLKNPVGIRKPEISDIARKTEALQGKKRPLNASPPSLDPKSKKATSRREELLKQLKAVEDAIAKKRSKV